MRIEDHVQLSRLREMFVCDPVAGTLTWKARPETCYRVATWNKRFAGQVAGRTNTNGHVQIVVKIDGVRYHVLAHRLIWAMAAGEWVSTDFEVDHRNTVRADNRIENLRVCLPFQNSQNRSLYANNTSGFKGVSWVGRYQKWGVQIQVNGGSLFKGYFDDVVDAAAAYDRAAQEHFGEFARTNQTMGLAA